MDKTYWTYSTTQNGQNFLDTEYEDFQDNLHYGT